MYKILLIPIIIGFGAQFLKIIRYARTPKDAWKQLLSYGGMSSSHTAFVTSVTMIVFLSEGLKSPLFALSLVYALLIIRDAVGLRQALGQHGQIINRLRNLLPSDERINIPPLEERMGHTPTEALAGAIWGIIGSLVLWSLL